MGMIVSGKKWTATRVDLVFGSNSQLRALAEVYAMPGLTGKIPARLYCSLEQGYEPGPFRSCLIPQAGRLTFLSFPQVTVIL